MKIAASTKKSLHPARVLQCAMGAFALTWAGAGCSKAPQTPPAQQTQQVFDSQIQAIQNNSNMSDDAKQQAIAGIKSQQSKVATQP